jgi:hypothetical protein
MGADDEWLVVGGKGKPRRNQRGSSAAALAPPTSSLPSLPLPPLPALPGWGVPAAEPPPPPARSGSGGRRPRAARTLEERLEALAASVAVARAEVAAAPALARLRAAMAAAVAPPAAFPWPATRCLVVYGLGCIEDSRVSRYQLAYASILKDLLPGLAAPPQLFDPAFSKLDAALLPRLGMAVIPEDERGGRAAEAPTLFYLPHCEVGRWRQGGSSIAGPGWGGGAPALPNRSWQGACSSRGRVRNAVALMRQKQKQLGAPDARPRALAQPPSPAPPPIPTAARPPLTARRPRCVKTCWRRIGRPSGCHA